MKTILIFCITLLLVLQPTKLEPMSGPGSRKVENGEFPFTVSLIRKKSGNSFCAGALITKKHVLTAGHCFAKKKPNSIAAAIGDVDSKKAKLYDVSEFVTFDEWSSRSCVTQQYRVNDIAIVLLVDEVPESVAETVHLRYSPSAVLSGLKVTILGWGVTDDGKISNHLKAGELQLRRISECEEKYKSVTGSMPRLEKNFLYTFYEPEVAPESGDSGGPVVMSSAKKLIAIHCSRCVGDKPNKSDAQAPAVETHILNQHLNIYYYRNFIESITSSVR